MIRVSRRTSVADDEAKARAILAQGGSTMFAGDARHLRRLRDALSVHPGVDAFLGDHGDDVVLVVQPTGPGGSLYSEKITQPAT